MKLGFLQFAPVYHDPAANVELMVRHLERTFDALIVMPELALSGYLFRSTEELRAQAFRADDAIWAPLYDLLKGQRLHVAVGFAEHAPEGVYNSMVLAGPDGPVAVYRKIHLFDREHLHFLPGQEPPPVVDVCGVKVGLMVCWDWYFPETARSLARRGAQIIAHGANLVLPWCLDAMRTRSLENRVFTVTANRTGVEEVEVPDEPNPIRLSFYGRSQVVDTKGNRILAVGANKVDGAFTVDVDPAQADDKAVTPRNPGMSEARLELLP